MNATEARKLAESTEVAERLKARREAYIRTEYAAIMADIELCARNQTQQHVVMSLLAPENIARLKAEGFTISSNRFYTTISFDGPHGWWYTKIEQFFNFLNRWIP